MLPYINRGEVYNGEASPIFSDIKYRLIFKSTSENIEFIVHLLYAPCHLAAKQSIRDLREVNIERKNKLFNELNLSQDSRKLCKTQNY